MSLPPRVRRLLRLRDPLRDVDEELDFHFAQAIEDLVARGLSESAARQEAERRFGDLAKYRRELESIDQGRARAERRRYRVAAAWDVAHHAVRSLVRSPGLAVAVVLTLGLGLGVNVGMYGIVDRLLLSAPPHVASPDELRRVMIEVGSPEAVPTPILTFPDFSDLAGSPGLAGAAVWSEQSLTLGHGLDAQEVRGLAVSGDYFPLRGARAAHGRLLGPSDDVEGGERVAVISYELWRRDYGGSPDVLGRTLEFGSSPYAIVGVAPRGMTSLRLASVDVWLPVRAAVSPAILENRRWSMFAGVVRLASDASEEAVAARLSSRVRHGREGEGAGGPDPDVRVRLTPLLEARGPQALPETTVAKWLAAVSLIVLAIACANVANLLLARLIRQSRELAVRLALGVSRARLVGQLLLEGAVLGLLGGGVALLFAGWMVAAMGGTLLPGIAWSELDVVPGLLPGALALAVLVGLLSALAPALHASRRTVAGALRLAGAGGGSRTTRRLRTGLALTQAALSVILLVGAGLFVRSLDAVRALDLGYRVDDLVYVETRVAGTPTDEERAWIGHAALARLRDHPAMAGAAAGTTAPLMWVMNNAIRLPDTDPGVRSEPGMFWENSVTADYFRLLGMRVVHGRGFEPADYAPAARPVVVSESMARSLWRGNDPLGECLYVGDATECSIVVGVVADARAPASAGSSPMQFFLPMTAEVAPEVLIVRPRSEGAGALGTIRSAVVGVDPRVRYVQTTPAAERLEPHERSWRLGATLFSAFGALALLVAGLGLYAVLAFDVSQRRREIGVRAALGASPLRILRLVMARALGVTAIGLLIGGAAAALVAPRFGELLFHVGPHDPPTYAAVTLALLAVATAASWLPARRAAAVDPSVTLRAD